jgi:hypothetical protein
LFDASQKLNAISRKIGVLNLKAAPPVFALKVEQLPLSRGNEHCQQNDYMFSSNIVS